MHAVIAMLCALIEKGRESSSATGPRFTYLATTSTALVIFRILDPLLINYVDTNHT